MTPDRRYATKLILTGSLAAPALIRPSSALAEYDNNEPHLGTGSAFEWAVLSLALASGARTNVRALIILTAVALAGYDLRQQVRRRNALRANARNLPLIGHLLTTPVVDRLAKTQRVANIHLIGQLLVLAFTASASMPRQTTIVHREHEYLLDGRPKKMKIQGDAGQPDQLRKRLNASNAVGKGFLTADKKELIALIPPHRGIAAPN